MHKVDSIRLSKKDTAVIAVTGDKGEGEREVGGRLTDTVEGIMAVTVDLVALDMVGQVMRIWAEEALAPEVGDSFHPEDSVDPKGILLVEDVQG